MDSWWRWLFWHCSYCFCKCDAPGPDSDRYWSLKEVTADIESNKIISGIRFVKKNRVIQIEIEQTTSLPEGLIDTDRSWTEAENLDVDDKANVYEMFYENRALDLDLLEAPPGHVITGVRLRKLGVHLNLEARVTPINFKNGTLNPSLSTWIGHDKTQESEVIKSVTSTYISTFKYLLKYAHLWSLQNFCITVFLEKFRESNFFSKEFTLQLISRNICQVIQKFHKLHTVRTYVHVQIIFGIHNVEITEIYSHALLAKNS